MCRYLAAMGLVLFLRAHSLQAQEGYGATLAPKMPVGAVVVPAETGALAQGHVHRQPASGADLAVLIHQTGGTDERLRSNPNASSDDGPGSDPDTGIDATGRVNDRARVNEARLPIFRMKQRRHSGVAGIGVFAYEGVDRTTVCVLRAEDDC